MEYLRDRIADLPMHYANLKAAVHTSLKASDDGEDDPLWYVRDELAHQDDVPALLRYRRPYLDDSRGERR